MAERQTATRPIPDVLRARVLEALSAGISPQAQETILKSQDPAERIGASLSSVGQRGIGQTQSALDVLTPGIKSLAGLGRGAIAPGSQQPETVSPPTPVQMPINQGNNIKKQEPEEPKGKSGLMEFLSRMGIPIGAAIAGSVAPGFLPEAAGLSTGFVKGQGEEREFQQAESEAQRKAGRDEADASQAALDTAMDVEQEARKRAESIFKLTPPKSAEEFQATVDAMKKHLIGESSDSIQGAPDAPKEDGKFLLDELGNRVAVSVGGQWQSLR